MLTLDITELNTRVVIFLMHVGIIAFHARC